jgi:hypothetical protein
MFVRRFVSRKKLRELKEAKKSGDGGLLDIGEMNTSLVVSSNQIDLGEEATTCELVRFRPSAAGKILKARASLQKMCVDCITGITSSNKIVHQLLSILIYVVVVIEPTPIHSIAYIHHPGTSYKLVTST